MEAPFEFPPMLLFALFITVVVILATIAHFRRQQRAFGLQARVCPGCGQSHPAFAQFCRRCGAKL